MPPLALVEGIHFPVHSMNDALRQGHKINGAPKMHAGRKSAGKPKSDDSLLTFLCASIVKHQLGLSILCILFLALTHVLFASLRSLTIQYFVLSYYDTETGLYTQGPDDLKFVLLWIVIFTALRAAIIDYVFVPLAKNVGVTKPKATIRFAEQAWLLLYGSTFWALGTYLMYSKPYFFDLPHVWSDFPSRSMTGLFKWYYLAQFAFWLQQILVVNIEERRKDHWQMLTHHIITSVLMFFSYGYYQTKVGNTILCIMDVVELFFPLAKLLKYAGYQTLCDLTFAVFIVVWFVARHCFYLAVCWSIYVDVPQVMKYGCYNAITGEKTSSDGGDLVLANVMHAYGSLEKEVCFNQKIHYGFLSLLLALQAITVVWFCMIVRVAYGVIIGNGAQDTRSDDEGEEEESMTDISQEEPLLFQEVEVEAEDMYFARQGGPSTRSNVVQRIKRRGNGISLPRSASDHKELLGRIGCDKSN